jgi:hypothetical protein
MGVDLAYRMRRGRGFVHPPYEANGELIERAPGLYNAGLNPAEAVHGLYGVPH